MGTALMIALLIGAVAYLVLGPGKDGERPRRSRAARTKPSPDVPDWLRGRWAMMDGCRPGDGGLFPRWYFDPMTEFQARRLTEDGMTFSPSLTKGQASDLIGLGESPDDEDLEVLRFFKRPLRGMNKARARHEVAVLFQDEANRRAWEDRPATDVQREFYRFFGMSLQAGLPKRQADAEISQKLSAAQAESDPRLDHWRTLAQLFDDFSDAEFREGYDMKKPSLQAIRKAAEALAAEAGWEAVDSDRVAERLLETHPSLQK